jgi:hypothetical protein
MGAKETGGPVTAVGSSIDDIVTPMGSLVGGKVTTMGFWVGGEMTTIGFLVGGEVTTIGSIVGGDVITMDKLVGGDVTTVGSLVGSMGAEVAGGEVGLDTRAATIGEAKNAGEKRYTGAGAEIATGAVGGGILLRHSKS